MSARDRVTELLLKNVKCFLCLEPFKDPRLLDCCHSFCLDCLEAYTETFEETHIECPLCDKKTERPKKVKDLKKNIYIDFSAVKFGTHCSICGEREFAKSHCIECDQDFCRSCIRSHGGITTTREHHLVDFDKQRKPGRVSRDLFCKVHPEEKMVYYCVECNQLICKHCNLTAHKNHASKHASEVASKLRNKLKRKSEHREHKNYLVWLAERREMFNNEIERNRKCEKRTVKKVTEMTDSVIAIVEEIKNILLKRTRDITKKQIQPLKQKMEVFEKYILSFAELLLHSRNLYEKADDIEIVNTCDHLTRSLESLKHEKDDAQFKLSHIYEYPVFKPGKATADQLLPFFGDVHVGDGLDDETNLTIYDFYTEKSTTILSMIPLEDERLWVIDGEGDMKLYDSSGRVHKQVSVGIQADDIISTEQHIIISGNASKMVKVFDRDIKEVASINTELCCRGVAVDRNDDSIYVCLTEKNAFFDHDSTHSNKIVRIMPTGARYEISDIQIYAGNPTVEYPARIVIKNDGLVAVSDWKRNCLTILNKVGYVEKQYFFAGIDNKKDKICPRGICTDQNGSLYLADYMNSRILKMRDNDYELHEVLTTNDGINKPWSIAISRDGLLWIGSKDGKISVHYFKQPDHAFYE